MYTNIFANTNNHNLNTGGAVSLNAGPMGANAYSTSSIGASGVSNAHGSGFTLGGYSENQAHTQSYTSHGFNETHASAMNIDGTTVIGDSSAFNIGANGISLTDTTTCCGQNCTVSADCCNPSDLLNCINQGITFFTPAAQCVGQALGVVLECLSLCPSD